MRPIVRGSREFLYDEGGRKYIDAISGVYNASYGHAHPSIVNVLRSFPVDGVLNCYDNPTPERQRLEEMLRRLTGFGEVHLFSSGAEAVEKALMLALRSQDPRRQGVLHFQSSFHGKTMGTYGLFDEKHRMLLPYRTNRAHPEAVEEALLQSMRGILRNDFGIVILEPVMGYYGYIFSEAFLRGVREICTETESILIFDEMITSFGRTGIDFVSRAVKPDLLVIGKNLGQGLPITAVLFDQPSLVDAEDFSWTTATSSNALLCRVGIASCEIFEREKMTEKSTAVGKQLRAALVVKGVLKKFALSHTGSMLFLHREDDKPMREFEIALREEHSILTRAHGSTIVLMPPYITSNESCRRIATAIGKVLENE